jgi:hypothetical protein
MKIVLLGFLSEIHNQLIIGVRHVKFYTKIKHKYTLKFCANYIYV